MNSNTRRFTLTRTLYVGALAILLGTFGLWLAGGAHLGWTQTSVVELRIDEITGIEYPVRQDAFVAGIEVLAAGLGAALVLGAAGWTASRESVRRRFRRGIPHFSERTN